MSSMINPFHTLYLTEGVGEFDFPVLFSPVLIPFVEPLFLPGNVLLKGMQGTGKSMLLSLLDSNVRLAFWENDRKKLSTKFPTGDPLKPADRRFIGAGINLSYSKALKLNELVISKDPRENAQLTRAYFADFVNCSVLRDLLGSLQKLVTQLVIREGQDRLSEIGLCGDVERLEAAAQKLLKHPTCDFLAGNETVVEIREALDRRLHDYRRRINSPRNQLPDIVDRTRSLLGEPLEAAAELFRDEGVISPDTHVFVTIDQFETLSRRVSSGLDDEEERSKRFKEEIEGLISNRVRSVYYRIGTRPNSLLEGCDASRDYVEVDLDRILQRRETDRRKGVFHWFLEDAFRRRFGQSGMAGSDRVVDSKAPLKHVFGTTEKLARQGELNAPKNRTRVVNPIKTWPDEIGNFLVQLAETEPVAARLGEAWVRQQAARLKKKRGKSTESDDSLQAVFDLADWQASGPPWMRKDKQWWRKERMPVAVLQIAASNAQRCPHSGEMAIVQLSGENVLAFLSICREIWECHARFQGLDDVTEGGSWEFPFATNRQAEGIREASRIWHDKMASSPTGHSLLRFLDLLGKKLHEKLVDDRQMSYPGANGISLTRRDYETDPDIKRLLDDATAECYLLRRRHTPKTLSRGESIKWYPHPILAPYYELTVPHTKEPLYLTISKLRSWLETGSVLHPTQPDVPDATTKDVISEVKGKEISTPQTTERQMKLFDKNASSGEGQ